MTEKKTWSDRFSSALNPAIALFNASIGFDIQLLEFDLTGSVAHAQMLAKTGIISEAEAEELVAGLEQIRQEYREGKFNPSIEDEDVHFAVERRLIEIVGNGERNYIRRDRATTRLQQTSVFICESKLQKFAVNCENIKGFSWILLKITWKP